jgi:hypothetical protein
VSRRASPRDALLEYHEAPPAIVRDMEEWLAVGDRRAMAESVRRWLLESYALEPVKAHPRAIPGRRVRRARPAKKR